MPQEGVANTLLMGLLAPSTGLIPGPLWPPSGNNSITSCSQKNLLPAMSTYTRPPLIQWPMTRQRPPVPTRNPNLSAKSLFRTRVPLNFLDGSLTTSCSDDMKDSTDLALSESPLSISISRKAVLFSLEAISKICAQRAHVNTLSGLMFPTTSL